VFQMKISVLLGALVLAAAPAAAAPPTIAGEYVEARTAEVFTGGCIMSSEAETIGRQAVLAWRIAEGRHDGVRLDGLSVVVAVSGDRNLGIREIGGDAPTVVRSAVIVDERATPAQRRALVAFARQASNDLVGDVVDVRAAPIRFESDEKVVHVSAGAASLTVQRGIEHKPGCGAMQWFRPFSTVSDARIGFTTAHSFTGASLGARWSHPNRKSAFAGTFAF
jgi:hypothetical protein